MSDCIFCRIVAGEIPGSKVLEDSTRLAFMDINPLQPGHVLLIPKKHYERVTDMPPDEVADLMKPLPELARAVVAATEAEGFNVFQTNGAVSGQVVPHVHFHIIPRREGDGLGFRWNPGQYAEGEMEAMRNKIAANLHAFASPSE